VNILDCTLRDGGYYNDWNFPIDLIERYLAAITTAGVPVVEVGFRSLTNSGFKGPCAFSRDEFLDSLDIPDHVSIGVMVNGSELVGPLEQSKVLEKLFPRSADASAVGLVRIACHMSEFEACLPATKWLKGKGYKVGMNLMQVADRGKDELISLAKRATEYPIDVLYFADSLGSMGPEQTAEIVHWFREGWSGAMGIHTHDNMGRALQNTLRAYDEGVSWLDTTVTGMGRGPGNAKTEELLIEAMDRGESSGDLVPLMKLIREYFDPLRLRCGWGKNFYYYLAGKYGIHPTYIQSVLGDSRYKEEEIFSLLEYLKDKDAKSYSSGFLQSARLSYPTSPKGTWSPRSIFPNRDVLILGTGPSLREHRVAIQNYIQCRRPVVLALNTQSEIESRLIDFRIACHPLRLLADFEMYKELSNPLITPLSMLPEKIQSAFTGMEVLDFGVDVQKNTFQFFDTYCVIPSPLVFAYAIAIATSGHANKITLAGFDGYGPVDPRTTEMQLTLDAYKKAEFSIPILAITPSCYHIDKESVYAC